MNHIVLIIIASLLMLPGILGVLIPVLPGVPYMFVIAVIFGFVDKFVHLSGQELAILGAIALLSLVVDYFSGIIGAKYGGASKKAYIYGFIGLIVGLIIFPPFGGIIGLFVGVLIAELSGGASRKKAVRAATGSLAGSLAGIAINLLLSIIFLILFVTFALKG